MLKTKGRKEEWSCIIIKQCIAVTKKEQPSFQQLSVSIQNQTKTQHTTDAFT